MAPGPACSATMRTLTGLAERRNRPSCFFLNPLLSSKRVPNKGATE